MEEILKCLNGQFCHVHRSYIVNLAHIKERIKNELIMPDGQRINVSKNKKKNFDKQYDIYGNVLMQ